MPVVVHAHTASDTPPFDPSGLGVDVVDVESEAEALDALAASDVDCVVCEIDADSGAGLAVVRAVRARDPSLPVIAYTASSDGELATEATRAGATEYVSAERLRDGDAALRDRVRSLVEAGTPLGPVVEGSPDPTLLLAGGYSVRYLNPAATAFLAGAVADGPFTESVHPGDVGEFRSAAEGGGDARVRVRGSDGTWTRVAAHVTDRRTDRRVHGFVVTLREAETADVDEDIVAQAVHDLRTPLATAQTYLDIAADEPERLEDVKQAHDRLAELVSDVRTLAAANSGLGETEPVSLEAVAREAWDTAGAADVDFVIDDDPGTVTGEEKSLRRLFENLFRNACEHGASTVTVESIDGGFAVSDDGDGIPESDRETVFTQGFTTRSTGTGYGLAIVRSVARAHDFGVTVEESDTGGARFVFTR